MKDRYKTSPAKTTTPRVAVEEPAERRRANILEWMRTHESPVHGDELAQRFRVSRQCLVQDVAILRARGQEILGTPRGYRLPEASRKTHKAILACKHPPERTEEELNILADHGVKVLDVIVEHPVYGELKGSLMLESRTDVQDFLKKVSSLHATLLSSLTDGVHLHTVEASRPEMIARAKEALRARGFLLK